MKTAVFLSAASLAAAFVIPGNDQQLLAALSKDAITTTGGIAPSAEEIVQPEQPKERLGHDHHDNEDEKGGYLVGSAGKDGLKLKWHGVAAFVEGLERSVQHFEEIDLEWLGRSGESFSFGWEKEMMKEEKNEKKKDKKKHGKKHGDDGKHFDGKKHHKSEYADHEVDEFDIPACFYHRHGQRHGFFSKAIRKLKHMLGFPAPKFEDGAPPYGPPPHGHPPHGPPHDPHHGHHHDSPTSTIYEQISQSKHTRIFTRIINQYDEVVKYLNSTSATNYTVFVPIDAAFEGIHHPHHNISKEAILHWLEYHISPEVFTLHDFFDVQTVPTLRHEETEKKFPQRISTSLTRKGLTLNFHSHVIRPDIHATNGIIHAIDKLLIPALSAKTAIEFAPSLFSTLDLALIKTGLIDKLDPSTAKIGGTFFAPTNQAFAKLPATVNAFLFSAAGQKYLKALLKYHLVPGHIVFTDAYYKSQSDDGEEGSLVAKKHLDLPTYLNHTPIAIDIRNFHRLTLITVNKHTPVSVPNVPVKEGVIHLVSSILLPPHKHGHDHSDADLPEIKEEGRDQDHDHHDHHEVTVHELMERLEAYVE
ncbi:Hypothetical protein PENO1_025030 [Penicillium occitanis (nom. inval.)]|nr:hypothetical protein PENOC_053780 [Penicillium occitanis (nom. inval.)]PCH04937.1 Hypothetical protein PENO1_025030 [Penicillium occitanis (nom. inval.)]